MPSNLLVKLNSVTTAFLLGLGSILGLLAFGWPLLTSSGSSIPIELVPALTGIIVSIALLVIFTAISAGQLNSKSIALLGLLSALIAAARVLGAHAFGVEPMWALIVIAGRALGPVVGFSAGSLGMASSAIITGGIGPWLPFQMLAAGWVGLVAGLLPIARSKFEPVLLAFYGAFAAIVVGLLLNLWFWPTAAASSDIAFQAGAPLLTNISRLFAFTFVTSLSFDVPRAFVTFLLVVILAKPMLITLRRVTRPIHFAMEAA